MTPEQIPERIIGTRAYLPQSQRDFLDTIIHEDAAKSISGAVQWCIDACMRIEKKYGIDACYIAFNDIRLPENDPNPPQSPPPVEEKGIREWTPIAEGLPEANAECWVVIDGPKGPYVTEAHLIKDGQGNTLFTEWRDAEGWNFVFDITHWMLKIRPALPPFSSLPLPTDKK